MDGGGHHLPHNESPGPSVNSGHNCTDKRILVSLSRFRSWNAGIWYDFMGVAVPNILTAVVHGPIITYDELRS